MRTILKVPDALHNPAIVLDRVSWVPAHICRVFSLTENGKLALKPHKTVLVPVTKAISDIVPVEIIAFKVFKYKVGHIFQIFRWFFGRYLSRPPLLIHIQ